MKKVTISSFLLIITVALITSCGPSLKVSSDYDKSADFTTYRTFSMYDLKTSGRVSQLNRERIAKYIKAEMTKRGFKETNTNPDLMVNAVTVIKDKRSLVANSNYYSYGGFYRPYAYWAPASRYTTVSTYEYKDGSLVIDVVDAKTKKMIWEGTASAQFEKRPQDPDAAISSTVAKIMEAFPATAGNK
jgi:hypothetical protein